MQDNSAYTEVRQTGLNDPVTSSLGVPLKSYWYFPLLLFAQGCGGDGESLPGAAPLSFNLTLEPISSNADPTPLADVHFTDLERFAFFTNPPAVSIQAYFMGERWPRRLLSMSLPPESELTQGSRFEVSSGPTFITIVDNPESIFPNYVWSRFEGSILVSERKGRAVTLLIDAVGDRLNEGTGQLRVQGTIKIDFDRQVVINRE